MFSFTDTRITCWDITRTCTGLGLLDGDPVDAETPGDGRGVAPGRVVTVYPSSFLQAVSFNWSSQRSFTFRSL